MRAGASRNQFGVYLVSSVVSQLVCCIFEAGGQADACSMQRSSSKSALASASVCMCMRADVVYPRTDGGDAPQRSGDETMAVGVRNERGGTGNRTPPVMRGYAPRASIELRRAVSCASTVVVARRIVPGSFSQLCRRDRTYIVVGAIYPLASVQSARDRSYIVHRGTSDRCLGDLRERMTRSRIVASVSV